MKPTTHLPTRFANGLSVPLEVPGTTGSRPVRRGNFWPGESFGNCTRKWDLTGAFADHAFILPALLGGKGPRPI